MRGSRRRGRLARLRPLLLQVALLGVVLMHGAPAMGQTLAVPGHPTASSTMPGMHDGVPQALDVGRVGVPATALDAPPPAPPHSGMDHVLSPCVAAAGRHLEVSPPVASTPALVAVPSGPATTSDDVVRSVPRDPPDLTVLCISRT